MYQQSSPIKVLLDINSGEYLENQSNETAMIKVEEKKQSSSLKVLQDFNGSECLENQSEADTKRFETAMVKVEENDLIKIESNKVNELISSEENQIKKEEDFASNEMIKLEKFESKQIIKVEGYELTEIEENKVIKVETYDFVQNDLEEHRILKCSLCSAKFSQENTFKSHISICDGTIEPFKCPICDRNFIIQQLMIDHISSDHRNDNKEAFECYLCKVRFSHENLQSHFKTVHKGRKPFKCTICNKTFMMKRTLADHISTVHEGKNLLQCSHCVKTFGYKTSLDDHISKVHEGKSELHRVQCKLCDKVLSKNYMRDHVLTVHERKKECLICHQQFKTKRTLTDHISTVHEEKSPTKTQPFDGQCGISGIINDSRTKSENHNKIKMSSNCISQSVNEGKKLYNCIKCKALFFVSKEFFDNHVLNCNK